MKKKILFIAHSNNDLDHYLPLIKNLNATADNYKPSILYIKSKEDVLTNEIHKRIINELVVDQISFYKIFKYKIILNPSIELYKFCKRKLGFTIIIREVLSHYRFDLLIMKLYIKITDKILNQLKTSYIPVTRIRSFLKVHSFSMIVLDQQDLTPESAKENLLMYALYNLIKEGRSLSIPIFMMSHGAVTFYSKSESGRKNNNTTLSPDILALCYENEISIFNHLIGDKTKALLLGDTRYDSRWIEKLENIARSNNPVKKPTNKYVILIPTRSFFNTNNHNLARNEVHNDILKLLDDFDDIELWFKAHPRYPLTTTINPNERIKVFFNNIDSCFLLVLADLIISPSSGLLFHPITQGRRVIYYDIWKKYCHNDAWTPFDNTQCVYKASNYEQLKKGVLTLRENQVIKEEDLNQFYKSFISGGVTRNESIIENHINVINEILLTKERIKKKKIR